jgi:hypothetical protein
MGGLFVEWISAVGPFAELGRALMTSASSGEADQREATPQRRLLTKAALNPISSCASGQAIRPRRGPPIRIKS